MKNKVDIRTRRMAFLATERYILSLLKALAKSENKEFFTEYRSKEADFYRRFDGFAPNGISEIDGPVAIEIKHRFTGIRRIYDIASKIFNDSEDIKNILFVFGDDVKNVDLRELQENKIIIWDNRKLKELINKFPEVSFEFFNEDTFKEHLTGSWNNIVQQTVKKYENIAYNENKDQHIRNLQNSLNNDNLTLFLGSGVSKNVDLPDWKVLIKRLIVKFLKETYDNSFDYDDIDGKFKDFSYITLGSLVKHAYQEKFHENLRETLYGGYKRKIIEDSCLKLISKLCIPPRNGTGLQSIVTYNYDDLLEYYLDDSKIKYKVIFNENEVSTHNEIPIYHVHGYLPYDEEINDEISDSIIMAEDEYHHQYKDPYSWQNLIQLNLLKEKTALFIGLSMNDPNLRRLLDIAKRYSKSERHYAIIRDRWEFNDDKLSNIFRNMEEALFKDLGVNIIWYRDYSEINEIIRKIKF